MKNSILLIIIAIIVTLSIPHRNIMAQMEPGAFSIAPHIGWYIFDDDQDIDNAPIFGIGLGYNFTEHLGVEGIFNYVKSNSETTNDDIDSYIYRLDGLYHFRPDKQVVPYLAAGLGAITIDEDNTGSDTNTLFNYGGGIKAFITESLSFRGDIRHLIDLDDSNNNFAVTIGFTYQFGKKEKKAPLPPLDSDGDGVPDYLDKCPDTPLGVSVDAAGCPIDSDGDGVPDYLDKCPDTPLGVSVDAAGCPIDSDGDGVPDYLDKCPGTPLGVLVDEKGCPVELKETVSIPLKVQFDFDSSKIKTIFDDHLNKVSDFLQTHKDTTVVIEGHTCSIGTEQYNLGLSQRRAESVKKFLVNSGIEPARLKTVGYGESRPIADNKTKEGRQRNRRVTAEISTIVIKVIKK
jgi:OOP family OmpA-OmpF porin